MNTTSMARISEILSFRTAENPIAQVQDLRQPDGISDDERVELERIYAVSSPIPTMTANELKLCNISNKINSFLNPLCWFMTTLGSAIVLEFYILYLLLPPPQNPANVFCELSKTTFALVLGIFTLMVMIGWFNAKVEKIKDKTVCVLELNKTPNWNTRLHQLMNEGGILHISRKDIVPHEIALLSDSMSSDDAIKVLRDQRPEDTVALIRLTEKLQLLFDSSNAKKGPLSISGETHELLCRTLDTLSHDWKSKMTPASVSAPSVII